MHIQNANKEQAQELAQLINLAGEGIPLYLWSGMAEHGEDPMQIGRLRAAREEGGFSYKNARVYVEDGQVKSMIISYLQPSPYPIDDITDYPAVVKPLVLLESEAPGSWYINAVATFEQFRGHGIAQTLIKEAEEQAAANACNEVSLIVASENIGAKNLYDYLGYQTVSSLPVVDYPGCLHGGEWLLMIKKIHK